MQKCRSPCSARGKAPARILRDERSRPASKGFGDPTDLWQHGRLEVVKRLSALEQRSALVSGVLIDGIEGIFSPENHRQRARGPDSVTQCREQQLASVLHALTPCQAKRAE